MEAKFMFKKKPNIPSPPKPPGVEEIQEDLKNASADDVVFFLANQKKTDSSVSFGSDSDVSSPSPLAEQVPGGEDLGDPEVVYQKFRTFIEVNRRLKEMSKELNDGVEVLHLCDSDLKSMAADVRKQVNSVLRK